MRKTSVTGPLYGLYYIYINVDSVCVCVSGTDVTHHDAVSFPDMGHDLGKDKAD